MNGLDLESFLYLLRADLAAWLSLAAILLILALMTWTSWGSRQALRKCLVLSIAVHAGFWILGSPYALTGLASGLPDREAAKQRIRAITVLPRLEGPEASGYTSPDGRPGRPLAAWDRPGAALAVADPPLRSRGPESQTPDPIGRVEAPPAVQPLGAAPEGELPDPARPDPPRLDAEQKEIKPSPPRVAPVDPSEIKDVQFADANPTSSGDVPPLDPNQRTPPRGEPDGRNAPPPVRIPNVATRRDGPKLTDSQRGTPAAPGDSNSMDDPAVGARGARARARSGVDPSLADVDIRARSRAATDASGKLAAVDPFRVGDASPIAMDRATPAGPGNLLSDLPIATGRRALADVPEVYRPRLSPNRSAAAERAGASRASEQAVERALDWLARHQDADGRWDGGSQKVDGIAQQGDDSFTIHCPAGEICFGECYYFEADTAMTGLALLAYLGAGYTHIDGKYAQNVGKGIQFLLKVQRPNGDLRGESRAVGMYCHSMAALALCEAYALTGDPRLKTPVSLAVDWLAKARSRDKMSWRYEPYARSGDSSILGWVVMVFKSARVNGVPVPPEMQEGAQAWLKQVADGELNGLARYTPYDENGRPRTVTTTMTAEVWVCRQFLGIGGAGASSSEAAEYLLAHGPDREPFNLYYWYYGTLAMYQHGGEPWTRWNALVRDDLVKRQRTTGHRAGSWDVDSDKYGKLGGRIYSTALATLTLEVYYRYLRLYDAPGPPPTMAPGPERSGDAATRRAGVP
jgi:hypothetical protein